MVYQEAEYRFQMSQNGLLGGVVFINAQTFSAAEGTALQKLQPGCGLGARIKLNKVSKTNICIDYGFGTRDPMACLLILPKFSSHTYKTALEPQ